MRHHRSPLRPRRLAAERDCPLEGNAELVEGVERVADVRVDFLVQGAEPPFETSRHTLSLLDRVHRQGDGAFEIGVVPYDLFFAGTFRRSCPLVLDAQVTIAATATDWPVLDGVDIETEVRPDLMTNVVNGFGYLGAVSTHTPCASPPVKKHERPRPQSASPEQRS